MSPYAPDEYVPLIDCIMRNENPPTAAGACLKSLNIHTTTAEKVEACAGSDEGSQLLHDIGVETKNLDPKLNFVPWVLFNNVSVIRSLIVFSPFLNLFTID